MAQDVQVQEDKPSNSCCAALQKKHSKLLDRYAKLEEIKNRFRECTALVEQKYDAVEKKNESLKKEVEGLKLEVNLWKDEKDKEAGRRIDLEDEVSALQEEVRLLKQNGSSACQGADGQLQERLTQAEEEIKQLNELLKQEREKVALEKKSAELEKKKADDALKKFEKGRNKIREAQKAANDHRKKAEEHRLLWEKLQEETSDMKSKLEKEKSKSADAERKVEAEKQKAVRERQKSEEQQKLAETNLKKANSEKERADDLNRKLEQARNRAEHLEGELLKHKSSGQSETLMENLKKEIEALKSKLALEKSKYEAAQKKMEAEKQKAIGERRKANLAVVKLEEQERLAGTNLKKALSEKDRADDLSRKLEEASKRAEKLDMELRKHKSSGKSVEVQAHKFNSGRNVVATTEQCMEMVKNDLPFSKWVEKMLLEKEHNITREKKRADSAKKKAKKQTDVAEKYKKISMEQKHRADQLSGQLEKYKLSVEELQKELQELVSLGIYANTAPIINNDVIFETDTVKLLKKQMKLEKLLAKHAKEATKIEAFRNKMLQQELHHLKQESLQFQQRLNNLDKSFMHGSEGIDQLKKIAGQTAKREILGSDWDHMRLMSGIDSRMDPPYRGTNQKMLQSSAINSSSASFSDRPLVGSQERGPLSIMTSASLGEDISNFNPKISDMLQDKRNAAKADNRTRSPIKDCPSERRVGLCEKKRIHGTVESVENLYVKGEKLHRQVSGKLSVLHDILNGQMDEPEGESLIETSCRELSRPLKKRKTTSEGTVIIHRLQDAGDSIGMLDLDSHNSEACVPASSPRSDAILSDCGIEDGTITIYGRKVCAPDFDQMVTDDYMKLLDMDNAADEESYRRAIASPLSPTLPEVQFHRDERLEVGSTEIHKSFQEDNVIAAEKTQTRVLSIASVPSHIPMEHNSVDFSKDMVPPAASDAYCQQIYVSGQKLGIPSLSGSGNADTTVSCENRIASGHGDTPKCYVVSSDNKDGSSLLRILQTICSCMPQCSFGHSVEIFIQNITRTLSKAKDLSTREKACVFLSLILPEISELGLKSMANGLGDNLVQALGSVSILFKSALSDPALRKTVMESCDLFELLALIEDFLQHGKVFVCGGVSAELESHVTSKLNLNFNGTPIMLLEVAVSANLLVAGGSLLASLCSVADHIGYVCEVSCNIIRLQKLDRPIMLAIFHAFALICGSKYFSVQQYSIAMAVVKSLVMFLEKQNLSANSTSFSQSDAGTRSSILLCNHCPFSAGAVPMEDVAVMLLDNLQKQCRSGLWPQDSLALVNFPRLLLHEEGSDEFSGFGEAAPLSHYDENLCNFLDIISLIEVLASVMSWDWTSDHLIGQVSEFLELHLMEGFAGAIILLLGQIGRHGVSASGYEDPGVKKIRGMLSCFASETTFKKLSISVQFAIITSLFGVAPIKFEEIAEGKTETYADMSQSIPHSFIRDWFSSLNPKQQSFLRLHLASSQGNH